MKRSSASAVCRCADRIKGIVEHRDPSVNGGAKILNTPSQGSNMRWAALAHRKMPSA